MNLSCPPASAKDLEPAASLLAELETRITTQPLHYRSGDEETAAKSVRDLFTATRVLLAKHPEAQAFCLDGHALPYRGAPEALENP